MGRIFPGMMRWMHILHLDHLLEFNSKVRCMLMVSCFISLSYSVSWFMDFIQLNCFASSPWTKEGLGKWTCLWELFGGVIMFFMFQHSCTALAYYDEDGEALRQKKERYLNELEKQAKEVLERATGQARKLSSLLSADLGDKVHEHVERMR